MIRRAEDNDGFFRYADRPVDAVLPKDICVNCGKSLIGTGSPDLFCGDECRNENPGYVHSYYEPCILCQVVAKAEPVEDLIRHSGGVISFVPLNPVSNGHRIFIPHQHVRDAAHFPSITGQVFAVAAAYGALEKTSFNLISADGGLATQSVNHLYIHYIPRRANDGLLLPWSEF